MPHINALNGEIRYGFALRSFSCCLFGAFEFLEDIMDENTSFSGIINKLGEAVAAQASGDEEQLIKDMTELKDLLIESRSNAED